MYQTIYSDYSQSDLMGLFGTSTWNSLSYGQRTQACQEVENRYAAENNVEPCLIMTEPMNGSCYGYYIDNTIYLNESMLRDGVFTTTYTDANGNTQTREISVLAPSWNTLDTVYHEGTHGVQDSQGRMPGTYISSDEDHDLYRIQGIEKEAYAIGQLRTLDALSQVEKNSGQLDASRNEYIASVRADSFEEAVQQAALNYNDANIEATLAAVIHDREQGIQPENPSQSYLAIQELCDDYDIQRTSDLQALQESMPDASIREDEIQNNNQTSDTSRTQGDLQNQDNSQTQSDEGRSDNTVSQEEALNQSLENNTDLSENQSQDTSLQQSENEDMDDGYSDTQTASGNLETDYDDGFSDTQTASGSLGADHDDGYSDTQTASASLEADYDDGYSDTQTASASLEADYHDGYSSQAAADHSTDSQSVSDGMDSSSGDGMSGGSDGSMDMD